MEDLKYLKGKFITFEGGEGAGKTTQSKKFVEYLNNVGIKADWSREPGGCEEAEEIRNLLVNGSVAKWDGITELLLMNASRRVHTEKRIKPLLKEGYTVVSDRYCDSTLAYQGYGHRNSVKKIDDMQKIILDDFVPDLTIFLDLDPLIGLKRADSRGITNRFEDYDIEFHKRVREGFNFAYERDKKRYLKIDVADKSIDELFSEILNKSVEFFKRKE